MLNRCVLIRYGVCRVVLRVTSVVVLMSDIFASRTGEDRGRVGVGRPRQWLIMVLSIGSVLTCLLGLGSEA